MLLIATLPMHFLSRHCMISSGTTCTEVPSPECCTETFHNSGYRNDQLGWH